MRPSVLFLSHFGKECGVHNFGHRIGLSLRASAAYEFSYHEVATAEEAGGLLRTLNPVAAIWNHHPDTMPWLDRDFLRSWPIPHVGIIHEVNQAIADRLVADFFDFYIAADPTLFLRNPVVYKTGRLVAPSLPAKPPPSRTTIGSFGLSTPGKGFEHLVARVQEEFDDALVRINISPASFKNAGNVAREMAGNCRRLLWKKGVELEITHEFMDETALVRFLSGNSLNAFLYSSNRGRGIASVLDLALAAGRPVAVSDSFMFRHVASCQPSIIVENRTLREILEDDTSSLKKLAAEWSAPNLVWDYERIVRDVLSRPLHRISGFSLQKLRALRPVIRHHWQRRDLVTWEVPDSFPAQAPSVPCSLLYRPAGPLENTGLNRVLDDNATRQYSSSIAQLYILAPEAMHRLDPGTCIRPAFVLDTVYQLTGENRKRNILCVGSFGDPAAWSLRRLGFEPEEIDPLINYPLPVFLGKPTVLPGTYDIVFSTLGLGGAKDVEAFVREIETLLKPGGTAVFTCVYGTADFPSKERERSFSFHDLREWIPSLIPECRLSGVDQLASLLDSNSQGPVFASLVFRKGGG